MMLICYVTIGIVNSLALLVLSFMLFQNYALTNKIRRGMLFANFFTIVIILSEMGTTYFELGNAPFDGWYVFWNVLGFSISPVIGIFLGYAFHEKKNGFHTLLMIPFALNGILTLLSPALGLIFHVSDNQYSRGPFFFVYIITYVVYTLFFLMQVYYSIQKYPDASKYTLVLLILFVLGGTTIQISVPSIHVSWLCITFTLILCYAYLCELSLKKDALTNLLNRFAYEHCLQSWNKMKNVCILVFDVDEFKEINDRYGHTYGDSCLMMVAHCIDEVFSSMGTCYRIGGDEFCVLSPYQDEKLVQNTMKQFHKKLDLYRKTDPLIPQVSIGYSIYNKSQGTLKHAIKRADEQMYRSKAEKKASAILDGLR